ncbi:MAG: hypothetical protein ACKO2N_11245, partial [Tabrizicola sp.]
MLRLIFNSRWHVQLVLALAAFGLAVLFYFAAEKSEAEKAAARAAGIPEAVSLSSFDPSRDVHAADEIHVKAWINPEYNYELTKEQKGTDTVRRMFVLFGPEDAADSKTARAVILMYEHEV